MSAQILTEIQIYSPYLVVTKINENTVHYLHFFFHDLEYSAPVTGTSCFLPLAQGGYCPFKSPSFAPLPTTTPTQSLISFPFHTLHFNFGVGPGQDNPLSCQPRILCWRSRQFLNLQPWVIQDCHTSVSLASPQATLGNSPSCYSFVHKCPHASSTNF